MDSSLDMNTLASSLPSSSLANAETDLMNNFKAAALSITTLYRSSRTTSKRAYNAGYAAACRDLLVVIQQGVSAGGAGGGEGEGGMTIGRVMDWVEARLEAIKAREEEEEEEEEKEKGGRKPAAPAPLSSLTSKVKETSGNASSQSLPTRQAVLPQPTTSQAHSSPSPSPPPPSAPVVRALRSKLHLRPLKDPQQSQLEFPDLPSLSPLISLEDTPIGTKRRHAAITMHDGPMTPISNSSSPDSSVGTGTGSNRRRTKSTRGIHTLSQNLHPHRSTQSDAMDVEDEGRERKRVARR